jgi:hypothetical protein
VQTRNFSYLKLLIEIIEEKNMKENWKWEPIERKSVRERERYEEQKRTRK